MLLQNAVHILYVYRDIEKGNDIQQIINVAYQFLFHVYYYRKLKICYAEHRKSIVNKYFLFSILMTLIYRYNVEFTVML